MTIAAWVGFGFIAVIIFAVAIVIALAAENTAVTIISILVAVALCFGAYAGIHWLMNNTAGGQRAIKTQESNFNGGLERTVTVYSYDGDILGEWSGKFDVTENDQETFFDVDGKRVIIQGGIIINEENGNE